MKCIQCVRYRVIQDVSNIYGVLSESRCIQYVGDMKCIQCSVYRVYPGCIECIQFTECVQYPVYRVYPVYPASV